MVTEGKRQMFFHLIFQFYMNNEPYYTRNNLKVGLADQFREVLYLLKNENRSKSGKKTAIAQPAYFATYSLYT